MIREILLALGLANGLFAYLWASFVYPNAWTNSASPHFQAANRSLLISIFLLAAPIFLYRWCVRRFINQRWHALLYFCSLGLLIYPLVHLRSVLELPIRYPVFSGVYWASHPWLAIAIVVFGIALTVRYLTSAVFQRIENTTLIILVSSMLITVSQVVFTVGYNLVVPAENARPVNAAAINPVMTLLFDEMAWGVTTPETRPELLKDLLPNIDRLIAESITFTQAYAPANRTILTIPSYFGPPSGSDDQSVFDTLKNAGVRSAVVGWFFQYCGKYGRAVDSCSRFGGTHYQFTANIGRNVHQLLRRSLDLSGNTGARSYFSILNQVKSHIHANDWTFLHTHWPIPHSPTVYDPTTRSVVDSQDDSPEGYVKNMALVDRTLGEVRYQLEREGLWNSMTVVVLSDHAIHDYRKWAISSGLGIDRRIPFIVKLPGQKRAIEYSTRFNCARLPDILRHLLLDKMDNAESLVSWLDQSASNTQAVILDSHLLDKSPQR